MKRFLFLWSILLSPMIWAQHMSVREYVLPNGLRLLMIPKKGDPNIAAGWPAKVGSVNERPGIRVAKLYFKPENRAVALYYTKKSESGEEDPLLTGLTNQEKAQVRQFRDVVAKMSMTEAKAVLQKLELQVDSAPSESKKFVQSLQKLLQDKIQKGGN
jgi:hypothetical protein